MVLCTNGVMLRNYSKINKLYYFDPCYFQKT